MICQLHLNQLPLRHLFTILDADTIGPNCFNSVIGKQLKNCIYLDVVQYKPIYAEIPNICDKDFSTSQKYLYNIWKAVVDGTCSKSLAKKQ